MSNIGLAIFCGLWYACSNMDFGYTIGEVLTQPVLIGAVLGIIMGQPQQGLTIGGTLELIYMGLIYPGGTVPEDAASAALIAIPIALKTGLTAEEAVVLAVPFGLLGTWAYDLKYTGNSFFLHMADKCAAKGDSKGLMRCASLYPVLLTIAVSFPLVFIANLVGPDAVSGFMGMLPDWVDHGIEVAGGVLPALGFAMAVYTIGKPKLLPYFFIGYFLVIYLQLSAMAIAIFATAMAVLIYFMADNNQAALKKEDDDND